MICRRMSKAIIRRRAARVATDCRANACCSSAPATPLSIQGSSTRYPNEQERKIARHSCGRWSQLAESAECRRARLLGYFGEAFRPRTAAAATIALPRAKLTMALSAQKVPSVRLSRAKKSGFDFGINQIAEVLTGADTEASEVGSSERFHLRHRHERSRAGMEGHWPANSCGSGTFPGSFRQIRPHSPSTYAGRHDGAERAEENHPDETGHRARARCASGRMKSPATKPCSSICGIPQTACGRTQLCRLTSSFSDVALRQMARYYPANERDFALISGVGEKKLRDFGEIFLREIAHYLGEQSAPDFCRRFVRAADAAAGARAAGEYGSGKFAALSRGAVSSGNRNRAAADDGDDLTAILPRRSARVKKWI